MDSLSRVIIPGGSGFVGKWMRRTQPEGIEARYLDHAHYREEWELTEHLDEMKPDAIVYLAPICPSRALAYAKKNDISFLYASSGAVYDRQDKYSDNKRLWEEQCKVSGADVVIARLFCFIGEYLQLNRYSIGQFIQNGLDGDQIHYYDKGCIRSYMYGEDLGRWMWELLLNGEGCYDIGSAISLTMRDVAETVAQQFGVEAIEDLAPEPGKPLVYLPDTSRARRELGLKETISLPEAIRRTIEWNRERMK